MKTELVKLRENMWAIEQDFVRAFLFVGKERSILVDTCLGEDIRGMCDLVSDAPITLITTHSDNDHIGCDHQFTEHYMHPNEFSRYAQKSETGSVPKPLAEGDVFTAGEYRLEVVLIPGHTPGSIALLDREHRFLISGDTVQTHCIYMFGDGRDIHAFRSSIAKLEGMRGEGLFDTVYASHGECVIPADVLPEHLALADEVIAGTARQVSEPASPWLPDDVKIYQHGRTRMYY